MAIQWQELDERAFEELPVPAKQPKGDAEWEELVTALESGKAVKVPFADEKEMRGKRLSLGRRSIKRGFRVELRYGDGFIAARKKGEDGPVGTEEDAVPEVPFERLIIVDDESPEPPAAQAPTPRRRRKATS